MSGISFRYFLPSFCTTPTTTTSWHSLLWHWDSGRDLLPHKGLVSFLSGIYQVEITFHNVFLLLFSDVLSWLPVEHVNIRTPGAELAPRSTGETCQEACLEFLCRGNFGNGDYLEIPEITWGEKVSTLPIWTRQKTTWIILKKPSFRLDVRGKSLEKVTGHCSILADHALSLFPQSSLKRLCC